MRHLIGLALPEIKLQVHAALQGYPNAHYGLDKYDVILIDSRIALTSKVGPSWLERLKATPHVPPIVILTARGRKEVSENDGRLKNEITIGKRDMNVTAFAQIVRGTWEHGLLPTDLASTSVMAPSRARSIRGLEPAKIIANRAMPAYSDDRFGFEVPGYDLLKRIGAGGMATVYLAVPSGTKESEENAVILKILRVEDPDNRTILRRFLREFRVTGALSHPNIVRISERGFANDFAYIAMEYCPNGDLSNRLGDGMKIDTAMHYLRQIALGLGEAHKHGIVHRDVKPANVLFRRDNSIALTDFGIAKAKEAAASLTMTNALVGTPHYLSPEQIRGMECDHRADLYSLGIVTYEMLTGERPFRAERLIELLDAHVTAPVPSLPAEMAHLQPILNELLAKAPEERYESAEALLQDLDAVL